MKRNASSGSLSFKRNPSSGSLFSLGRSSETSRSHSGLSGLSKIFGRRTSIDDDGSVGTGSTAVESVLEEEEEDADVMVMRSTRGKGKERAL